MDSGAGGEESRTTTPLRLLLVEDRADDALLIVRALCRAGYAVTWKRVEDADELTAALQCSGWDVVTCDWIMPCLAPTSAIALIRERDPHLPIVAVSGETREEIAARALRAGARHFVGKNELTLLAPAIEAVLCDRQAPRGRQGSSAVGGRTARTDSGGRHSV